MAKPGKKMDRRRKNRHTAMGQRRKADQRKRERLSLDKVAEDLGLKTKSQ